jgi:hypothetical protein
MTVRGRRKTRDGFTDKSPRLSAGIKTDPMRTFTATAITENGALASIAYSPSRGSKGELFQHAVVKLLAAPVGGSLQES